MKFLARANKVCHIISYHAYKEIIISVGSCLFVVYCIFFGDNKILWIGMFTFLPLTKFSITKY